MFALINIYRHKNSPGSPKSDLHLLWPKDIRNVNSRIYHYKQVENPAEKSRSSAPCAADPPKADSTEVP